MVSVSVIVPCYDEQDNIVPLTARIKSVFTASGITGEIVFVNDGSKDRTETVLRGICANDTCIKYGSHNRNQGITAAWETGLGLSEGEYVVLIDADMQYDPGDIHTLYRHIKDNAYDIVQGWRKTYHDSFMRKSLSRTLNFLLNVLFVTFLHDCKSGFIICKREVLRDVLTDRTLFRTFQHFIILCALKKGYSLCEVPVTFYRRTHGSSFIMNPITFSWDVILDMPRAVYKYGIFAHAQQKERA